MTQFVNDKWRQYNKWFDHYDIKVKVVFIYDEYTELSKQMWIVFLVFVGFDTIGGTKPIMKKISSIPVGSGRRFYSVIFFMIEFERENWIVLMEILVLIFFMLYFICYNLIPMPQCQCLKQKTVIYGTVSSFELWKVSVFFKGFVIQGAIVWEIDPVNQK